MAGATAAHIPPPSSPSSPSSSVPEDEKSDGIFLEDAAEDVGEDSRVYAVCGTEGLICGLNTRQEAHVGSVQLEKLYVSSGWKTFLLCGGTGQIMTRELILRHFDLGPVIHRQMASLQKVHPRFFRKAFGYSVDSDAEDHDEERMQPETTAILANLQPGCNRYFRSGCHDVLQWWCPMFQLRYLFAGWYDHVQQEQARIYVESYERNRPQLEGHARTASGILDRD